ncbi:hypothetical protein O3M35_004049 [Rhynocoris fuscipes]|uniref:Actin maturation protease n=1 Tax=Rhynocoris fuscipes TaxID=488301 RepID=A0AAW1CKF7_9HEMI
MDGALILIPYDADRDHSPGLFGGHKAHWGVLCGLILDGTDCVFVARQGKSVHPALWPLDQLNISNLNLIEIDPKRLSLNADYVIYDLAKSLRGMYIVLTPIK